MLKKRTDSILDELLIKLEFMVEKLKYLSFSLATKNSFPKDWKSSWLDIVNCIGLNNFEMVDRLIPGSGRFRMLSQEEHLHLVKLWTNFLDEIHFSNRYETNWGSLIHNCIYSLNHLIIYIKALQYWGRK